jgi:hypothetical protein
MMALAIGVLTVMVALAMTSWPVQAYPSPLSNVRAYPISCPATAGGISLRKSGELGGVSHLTVWVNSATPVYLGGGDITSTLGFPICTNTSLCPSAFIQMDAKGATCLSSSGTVVAVVLAGTL